MEELITEFKAIVQQYKHTIQRLKKHYDYPFTTECGHYYTLIINQNSLEVFERSINIIERFRKKRMLPAFKFRSDEFKTNMEFEIKRYPGVLTVRTQENIINYMKTLELIIEELEHQLNSFIRKEEGP
ncbi:hypothetical protein ACFPES_12505 [Paenibacillus sp. GCM10023248]|uniref:hypothetical protein n=1 Tax=unclassified Paenibacillus TaxID=185978 RepID=UPI0023795AF0|nr:hypothetical protein [Paenibacillus sp. MAHUQ-63]MDD9267849.1 hypothetical protein [Paenibacillus sp. MAHUQ-63]